MKFAFAKFEFLAELNSLRSILRHLSEEPVKRIQVVAVNPEIPKLQAIQFRS